MGEGEDRVGKDERMNGKDELEKEADRIIQASCRDLLKENDKLRGLLVEARDKICLECYGRKPEPETVKTMKKIEEVLG